MLLRMNARQANRQAAPLSVRCSGCRERVTLDLIGGNDQDPQFHSSEQQMSYAAGLRLCPNPECRALVFVIYQEDRGGPVVLFSYPPERIDFDPVGLPAAVLKSFAEAIACHAQECYVASAMMVRKTLEEVCRDQGASGKNLQDRISALGSKVILPQPLLDGLDDLRLLGNDAAHVESRDYEQVGSQEVDVAIDVTKEILKATYQLESIVGRLRSLRRQREADNGEASTAG
jgi:hypothetical protein